MVTFAPKSDVRDTLKEAALVIAALRSSAPVMLMAPKAKLAPTVSAVPSPNTAVPAPKLKVNARAVLDALFTVPLKMTLLLVVVKVVAAPNVTAPE